MKKFVSMLLVIAMCLSMGTMAFAEESVKKGADLLVDGSVVMVFNEYDYYIAMQNASDSELMKNGLSAEYIADVRSVDFKEQLLERANLPEDTLYSLGYTQDDIIQLKQFKENPQGNYDLRALSATLAGTILCPSFSTEEVIATYWWVWDKAPLAALTDAIALTWKGYSDGADNYVGCFRNGKSATVNYYNGNSILRTTTFSSNDFIDTAEDNCACVTFPVSITYSGLTGWAKQGEIRCVLENMSSSKDITDIKCCGAYGHTTLGVAPSFTIGADGFTGSFTPTSTVVNYRVRAVINKLGVHKL